MTKDEALDKALEALEFCKDLSLSMKEIERTEEAITAIKQARSAPAAKGWKLVPVNPTPEMLAAADQGDREYTLRNFGDVQTVMQGPEDHYVAMLAAAPAQPAPVQEQIAGFDVVLDESLAPNTMKFVQPVENKENT
jgi:hypothetical protein